MSRYSATETHFALLSIGEKRKTLLESEVTALSSRLSALDLAVSTGSGKSSILPDGFQIADSTDALAEQRSATIAALDTVKADLEDEIRKLVMQREENVRRRHNYVPMAVALVRQLAGKSKLSGLITAADQRRAASSMKKKKV